jgi:hypothetical protein
VSFVAHRRNFLVLGTGGTLGLRTPLLALLARVSEAQGWARKGCHRGAGDFYYMRPSRALADGCGSGQIFFSHDNQKVAVSEQDARFLISYSKSRDKRLELDSKFVSPPGTNSTRFGLARYPRFTFLL